MWRGVFTTQILLSGYHLPKAPSPLERSLKLRIQGRGLSQECHIRSCWLWFKRCLLNTTIRAGCEGVASLKHGLCLCMTESLCCSPETITTLLISYTPIQNKKFFKKERKNARFKNGLCNHRTGETRHTHQKWLTQHEAICGKRFLDCELLYYWACVLFVLLNMDQMNESRANWWATVHEVVKSWTRLSD